MLLISIRDAALALKATSLVEQIHSLIFHDKQGAEVWFQETIASLKAGAKWDEIHKEGVKVDFSKLIPSYVDRKPYFEMLTLGPI